MRAGVMAIRKSVDNVDSTSPMCAVLTCDMAGPTFAALSIRSASFNGLSLPVAMTTAVLSSRMNFSASAWVANAK